ncbi:sodium:solute symporter [Flavobacterium gelidilacus]|uniref:sodium:solute symporter n=1 Tax=Flavobacterium gelidilacus TaxID=206041 RepID=UPI0003F6FF90|nr:sodium:solute symporter [Flavobacterium gelidilacus]
MQPISILLLVLAYFTVLILFSYFTGRKSEENNDTFFKANRQSPWYLVAFGMIGASLSGVTFISVPGKVEAAQFAYFQIVIGYILGYFIIATVLLPLYYKLQLTSIYTYLDERFGNYSYKTGAWFFIVSRTVGSNLRLLLVADVLQTLVFEPLGIPYWITVTSIIFLIWVYTNKSGIKTIIWTDTLQTLFMLVSVVICIVVVSQDLGLNISSISSYVADSDFSKTFFFDDLSSPKYFWKQFFSGAFIAIVMTGLDQDMMQKNLTCKSLKDAQKNMFWFTIVLTFVNFLFLVLGLLFTEYALKNGIDAHKDQLFAVLANNYLGVVVAFSFILGLIAAAFSSADSALTSLTTSFSIDILNIEKRYDAAKQVAVRKKIHLLFVVISILVIMVFKYGFNDVSIIDKVLKFAGFTYGPLLGLYSFGLFTKWNVKDKLVPIVAILAVLISLLLNAYGEVWFNYTFGFEILMVNGFLTFLGLILIRRK